MTEKDKEKKAYEKPTAKVMANSAPSTEGQKKWKVQHRSDTPENWNREDPTLLVGEYAEMPNDVDPTYKVGTGGKSFSQEKTYHHMTDADKKKINLIPEGGVPTTLAEMTGDAQHRTVSDEQIEKWNNPEPVPTPTPGGKVPTKLSELEADAQSQHFTPEEKEKVGYFKIAIGKNKLNPDNLAAGFLSPVGEEISLADYCVSGFIPVEFGKTYTFYRNEFLYPPFNEARRVCIYDKDKKFLNQTLDSIKDLKIDNKSYAFIRAAFYMYTDTNAYGFGVIEGENAAFEPFNEDIGLAKNKPLSEKSEIAFLQKKDIESIKSEGILDIAFEENNVIKISNENGFIRVTLDRDENNKYGGNHVFNFIETNMYGNYVYNADDAAPMHVMSETLGANHGQPCTNAEVTAHGKTNKDIGTEWIDSRGKKFYIVQIIDENHLLLLSENTRDNTDPVFINFAGGNLTKGGETLVVKAYTQKQLYPFVGDVQHKVLKNGLVEVTKKEHFTCRHIDFVESYYLKNSDDILKNLIKNAGNPENPVYESIPVIQVENIYRFLPNLNVLVISTVKILRATRLGDIMFAQAERIGESDVDIKYYIPNSNPVGGKDFRKPLSVGWSSSFDSIYLNESSWADKTNPINRVIQYSDKAGFALGYLKKGVGRDLAKYTSDTFELRNNTGKIYPHGVDYTKVSLGYPKGGEVFNAVMYRCWMPKSDVVGRLSMYHFDYNGKEYVFVDYSASISDKIVVDDRLNGRDVVVVDSKNATLLSDVYNGGIFVKSTYVEGETSFIVLEI